MTIKQLADLARQRASIAHNHGWHYCSADSRHGIQMKLEAGKSWRRKLTLIEFRWDGSVRVANWTLRHA